MDKVDEDYFKEMVEAATSGEGGKRSNDVSIKDDGTTLEDIQVCILIALFRLLACLIMQFFATFCLSAYFTSLATLFESCLQFLKDFYLLPLSL